MRGQQRQIAEDRSQYAEAMAQRRAEMVVLNLIPDVVDAVTRERQGRSNAFRIAAQRAAQMAETTAQEAMAPTSTESLVSYDPANLTGVLNVATRYGIDPTAAKRIVDGLERRRMAVTDEDCKTALTSLPPACLDLVGTIHQYGETLFTCLVDEQGTGEPTWFRLDQSAYEGRTIKWVCDGDGRCIPLTDEDCDL
jgi:hypothetical protein